MHTANIDNFFIISSFKKLTTDERHRFHGQRNIYTVHPCQAANIQYWKSLGKKTRQQRDPKNYVLPRSAEHVILLPDKLNCKPFNIRPSNENIFVIYSSFSNNGCIFCHRAGKLAALARSA